MQQVEFKQVPIVYIKPDPNQPRKFFDEQAMQELTDSIRQKDVIQPVIVRGEEHNYMLVCGERRLKAKQQIMQETPERNTIPAMIMELTDEEALDLQIIENLQRKDVHPMEEAVAFESMLQHGMTVDAIAIKLGKSPFFIRQRLKLCNLTNDWQKAFFTGKVTHAEIIKIVHFPNEVQNDLYNARGNSSDKITFSNWDIQKYSGNLAEATFDLKDETLAIIGACTNCKYNTSAGALFPEDIANPRCRNITCFALKTGNALKHTVELAIEDPATIFVSTDYTDDLAKGELADMIYNAGFSIYKRSHFYVEEKPELLSYEKFKEEYDWESEEDYHREYQDHIAEIEKETAEFNQNIESGKFKKALVIEGSEKGQWIYIDLKKNSGAPKVPSQVKQSILSGLVTDDVMPVTTQIEILQAEITRLQDKEKRSKELDEQKLWELLRRHFSPLNNARVLKSSLSQLERHAMAHCMYEELPHDNKHEYLKVIDRKKAADLANVTDEELQQLQRFFFLAKLPPTMPQYNKQTYELSMQIAADYFSTVVAEIKKDQQKQVAKREARVLQKIDDAKAKIKELRKASKPAKEKGVKALVSKD